MASIETCWLVYDNEYAVGTPTAYKSREFAEAVARGKLNTLVHNGEWHSEKQFDECLREMVKETTYFACDL